MVSQLDRLSMRIFHCSEAHSNAEVLQAYQSPSGQKCLAVPPYLDMLALFLLNLPTAPKEPVLVAKLCDSLGLAVKQDY